MDFKRKVFKFSVDGKSFEVKHPTVRAIQDFKNKQKNEDDLEPALDMLENLGLPKEVAYELEPDHLNVIIENIAGAKKN
jgi:hypothetical protein